MTRQEAGSEITAGTTEHHLVPTPLHKMPGICVLLPLRASAQRVSSWACVTATANPPCLALSRGGALLYSALSCSLIISLFLFAPSSPRLLLPLLPSFLTFPSIAEIEPMTAKYKMQVRPKTKIHLCTIRHSYMGDHAS